MAHINPSRITLTFHQEEIVIHHFGSENNHYPPVLLIHGSIENGKIFFSKSGKGLAPFLMKEGFRVYVADLRGRGASRPKVSRNSKASLSNTVSEELPAIIEKVKSHAGSDALHVGAHSWGGVLLLSAYALFEDKLGIKSMIFMGTKRRISILSFEKLFKIDFGWTFLGRILSVIYGYLPAKSWGMGSDNEPKKLYMQTDHWVRSKNWIDPETGFNYKQKLQSLELPPIHFYTGKNDRLLGNPVDVRLLAEECGLTHSVTILGKSYGNKVDYDHISILTHPEAIHDHFIEIARLFRYFSEK